MPSGLIRGWAAQRELIMRTKKCRAAIGFVVGVVSFAIAIASCGASDDTVSKPIAPSPTPTPIASVDYDKAVELAIQGCRLPHLVLVSDPENIRAQVVSLGEADQLTKTAGENNSYSIAMDSLVWLVEMDGWFQIIGGPRVTSTPIGQTTTAVIMPTAAPWRGTCRAILDAKTGAVISIRN